MGKLSIKSFLIRSEDETDMSAIADRISDIHIEIIKRRLRSSGLSAKKQIEIIVKVAQKLKPLVIAEKAQKAQDIQTDSYKTNL